MLSPSAMRLRSSATAVPSAVASTDPNGSSPASSASAASSTQRCRCRNSTSLTSSELPVSDTSTSSFTRNRDCPTPAVACDFTTGRPAPPMSDRPLPTFAQLGLPPILVHALGRAGISAPFPIQAATIPDILAGRDVLGRGPTGSGKTLAFGLPLLVRLKGGASRPSRPRAVVLAPTRELAAQIEKALDEPALALGLRTATIVGGVPFKAQAVKLSRTVDVVIATPGRLADHVSQGRSRSTTSASPPSTRPTTWPSWGSCRRSPRSWTAPRKPRSGCCSRQPSTARWTRSSRATCTTRSRTRPRRPSPPSTRWNTTCCTCRERSSTPPSPASRPARAGRCCSSEPRRAWTASPTSCGRPGSRRAACTATSRRATAPGCSPSSPAGPCRCWWRPMSQRGASTSTTSRSSCTSTRPPNPRRTCTARAAPPAPGSRVSW